MLHDSIDTQWPKTSDDILACHVDKMDTETLRYAVWYHFFT